MIKIGHKGFFYFVLFLLLAISGIFANTSLAQSVNELEEKIEDRNKKINQLEEEIQQYQQEVQRVGQEKNTLQSAVQTLDLSEKKISTQISVTENKIDTTQLTIAELQKKIAETTHSINNLKDGLSEAIRKTHTADNVSFVEALLRYENMTELWDQFESLRQFQSTIQEDTKKLNDFNQELYEQKAINEEQEEKLVSLKGELSGQKQAVAYTKEEKKDLLERTKEEEAEYQRLLAEKKAAKEKFERELRELESQLKFTLDPNSIPAKGSGVFRWPVDNVYITQYFGNTEFARSGAYNGRGHNGVDFGVPIGTPVKAVASGEVIAVNEKVAYMCQYGKWVLVKHTNGLTTLYAHLSSLSGSIDVGKKVSTGEVLGFSGNTGYSTGPHLHFTVYASDAVEFREYTCNNGATLTIPISAHSGYLNPMDFLPQ